VVYFDGQFDDSRLLINLVSTAGEQGAALLNYAQVTGIGKGSDGFVNGVTVRDTESGEEFTAEAKVVINATGPFSDNLRRLADPAVQPTIAPSQGIHLVLDGSFLAGNSAIMVPHTSDGRVLFAIPWHGHTVVGTTDTPIAEPSYEPLPLEQEIAFILDTAAQFLSRPPTRADILSVYVGIRPLVKVHEDGSQKTSALSRDHTIHIDGAGLLTIVGGKWTTYRHMAEDCVNHAITLGVLPDTPCVTRDLRLHGYDDNPDALGDLWVYGADAAGVRAIAAGHAGLLERLHPELTYCAAEVVWAVREEMARTVEDVLARRTRALFLNARAAMEAAAGVAACMAKELGRDEAWQKAQVDAFRALAAGYVHRG
jgi:glycerol-3-phosphate dehydrogenase